MIDIGYKSLGHVPMTKGWVSPNPKPCLARGLRFPLNEHIVCHALCTKGKICQLEGSMTCMSLSDFDGSWGCMVLTV